MQTVHIEGKARERGTSHGEQLREQIHATKEFYARVFGMPERDVFSRAQLFARVIREFNDDYAIEIESMARAANIDPRWIYALNSRTELLSLKPADSLNECTALYFRPTSILGQTWDWGPTIGGADCHHADSTS